MLWALKLRLHRFPLTPKNKLKREDNNYNSRAFLKVADVFKFLKLFELRRKFDFLA